MPSPMSSVLVFYPMVMMACHVDVIRLCVLSKRELWHLMPDDVRLCVMPKGDDSNVMPNIVRPFVQSKVDDNMPRPTSSYYVCSPRAIMVYHTRQYSTLSMVFKGDDCLSRPTSFDSFFRTRAMMACLA